LPSYSQRQTLAGVLVEQGQDLQPAAVVGGSGDEIIAPDVVGTLRS
jgi:hypothetical protein